MLTKNKLFVVVPYILLNTNLFAQEHTVVWNTLQLPITLSSSWQIHTDISYRTLGIRAAAYQYTFRTGLRYFFKSHWSAAAGYASFHTREAFEKLNTNFIWENRLWQEITYEIKLKPTWVWQQRLRTEERFFAEDGSNKAYYAIRFRYRMAFTKSISSRWKLQLAEEIMEQLAYKKIDFQQNRLGASGIFQLNDTIQFQAGYTWSKQKSTTIHFLTWTILKNILANGNNHKK